jgi:alkylation response protein AidB-like acyl-CoA dehydrogenase
VGWIADLEILDAERARLESDAKGVSTWARFSPIDVTGDAVLTAVREFLAKPETRAAIDGHEAAETYPQSVLDGLWDLGLADLFCDIDGGEPKATAYHLTALNLLTSPHSGSLAVTVGVNSLALIAAYVGADDDQLKALIAHVRARHCSSMVLTELAHGSNLLRTEASAEPGHLDDKGTFVPRSDGEESEPTHYRLRGEKHLINGGQEHGLFVVLVRTRPSAPEDDDSERSPFAARAAHSVFWLRRDETTLGLERWATLPAQAADISGVRFNDTIVPATQRLQPEGEGFRLIQKTLVASRGGVAGLAAGTVSAARELAWTYASKREVYGPPIATLGGIADHLMRLDALDRLTAAASLRAIAWLNAAGAKSSPYTAIAKFSCCRLAEQGIEEARRVLGGRALLRQLPFERLSRDALLYGVFDGTSHVMLDELQGRLAAQIRVWKAGAEHDTVADARAVYGTQPRSLRVALQGRGGTDPLPTVSHAHALAALPGDVDVTPLAELALALFQLSDSLMNTGAWPEDQGLRFTMAECYGLLEALLGLVELFDPQRRQFLMERDPTPRPLDGMAYRFALGWFTGQLCSRLAEVQASATLDDDEAGLTAKDGFSGILSRALRNHAALRRGYASEIADLGLV